MNRIKVISYSRTSISAKAIARYQRGKNRIKPNGDFRGVSSDVIINWGYSGHINQNVIGDARLINEPSSIQLASDKKACLQCLENAGVPTLEFYLDKDDLEEAFNGEDDFEDKVYCRTLTRSHSGKGIVIASNMSEIVNAGLYTVEFKNDIEYRVHVFNGKIIDIQQKRRMSSERRDRLGINGIRSDVRNLKNGWSFTRNDIILRTNNNNGDYIEDIYNVPLLAIKELGLDFGAVDLLYNSETNEAIVCEVNTAAGQKVGTTTNYRYIKAINELAGNEINLDLYNNRWGSELTEFDNGMNEFLNNFENINN